MNQHHGTKTASAWASSPHLAGRRFPRGPTGPRPIQDTEGEVACGLTWLLMEGLLLSAKRRRVESWQRWTDGSVPEA